MNQSIGSIALYNIILIFLVIVFAFLAATVSYSKAFRVNSKIINAIEKYEGYNDLAGEEIENILNTLGYTRNANFECPDRKENGKDVQALTRYSDNYAYCIYYVQENARHYTYGVMTYLYIDLPFINNVIKLPVYTKTERIFKFNG